MWLVYLKRAKNTFYKCRSTLLEYISLITVFIWCVLGKIKGFYAYVFSGTCITWLIRVGNWKKTCFSLHLWESECIVLTKKQNLHLFTEKKTPDVLNEKRKNVWKMFD